MRNVNLETQSYGDIMSRYGIIIHSELAHHGIKGMKWGVRRYQNADGSLTEAGKKRYQKQIYNLEKKRNIASKVNEAYYTSRMLWNLGAIPSTAGLSVIPGVIAAQKQIKNDKKIDEYYDKKISDLRKSTKESNKLEKDLYNKNSKFKKMRDSDISKKELEKKRQSAAKEWQKKLDDTEKLSKSTFNICNSKTASSSDKVKAFKRYMENAITDDDHGGLGKPNNTYIYHDKDELRENVDWLADEFGFSLTESERRQVVDSYSKYFNKPIHVDSHN